MTILSDASNTSIFLTVLVAVGIGSIAGLIQGERILRRTFDGIEPELPHIPDDTLDIDRTWWT